MSLRVATNIPAMVVQKNLEQAMKKGNSQLEQLSSGRRINRAADDAAGMAVDVNLEAQNRGLAQAARNANEGISFVQTAEGGLAEISNILTRLREISIQSASDTVGDEERALIDKEYQQLVQEIDRISDATIYNGTNLINGEGKGVLHFQVGAFGGEENQIAFDSNSANSTVDNIGIDGTTVRAKGEALEAVEGIDKAINKISEQRAEMGSMQSRLSSAVNSIETQLINQKAAQSIIADVDVAEASAKLASSTMVSSAAVSTLAQANAIPASALKLIG